MLAARGSDWVAAEAVGLEVAEVRPLQGAGMSRFQHDLGCGSRGEALRSSDPPHRSVIGVQFPAELTHRTHSTRISTAQSCRFLAALAMVVDPESGPG